MALPNWAGNTRYVGPTGPSGPAGSPGSSGGQTLYLDSATSTTVPTLGTLLTTPILTAQTNISYSASSSTVLIAKFPTPVGGLASRFVPPGVWDLNIYAATSSVTNAPSFYWSLYQVDADGVSNPVLIVDGSADLVQITNLVASQTLYDAAVYVPSYTLTDSTKRLSLYLYVVYQGGGRTAYFEFRNGAVSHLHTTLGEIAYNWSSFPATTTVDIAGYDVSNVGTLNSTTISNSGNINSAFITNTYNVTTGAVVTSNITNPSSSNQLTIQSPSNDTVVSGNRSFLTADQGIVIGEYSDVNLTASNGNRGRINLTASQGYSNGINGEINLVANGGVVGVYPLDYATGGLINITANTPTSTLYTATSAIKLSAASILSYAGPVSPIGSALGYNYIQGTLGVNIVAGAGGSTNAAGTVYLYGYNGTTIQNGLYTDTIYGRASGNLNWNTSADTSFIVNCNLNMNVGSFNLTTPALKMISGNIDMCNHNISNVSNIYFTQGAGLTTNATTWTSGSITTLFGDLIGGDKYIKWSYNNNPGTLINDNNSIGLNASSAGANITLNSPTLILNAVNTYANTNIFFNTPTNYIYNLTHIYGGTGGYGGGIIIDYAFGMFFNSGSNNANLYASAGTLNMNNYNAGTYIGGYNAAGTGDISLYQQSNNIVFATGAGSVITNSIGTVYTNSYSNDIVLSTIVANKTIQLNSTYINLNGAVALPSAGTLNMNGGTINNLGAINASNLTISNNGNWTNTMTGYFNTSADQITLSNNSNTNTLSIGRATRGNRLTSDVTNQVDNLSNNFYQGSNYTTVSSSGRLWLNNPSNELDLTTTDANLRSSNSVLISAGSNVTINASGSYTNFTGGEVYVSSRALRIPGANTIVDMWNYCSMQQNSGDLSLQTNGTLTFNASNIAYSTSKFNGASTKPITNPGNLIFTSGTTGLLVGTISFQIWGPTWDGTTNKVGNLPNGIYSWTAQCNGNSLRSQSMVFMVSSSGPFGHQANNLDASDSVRSYTSISGSYGYITLNNTTIGSGDSFFYQITLISGEWDGTTGWQVY